MIKTSTASTSTALTNFFRRYILAIVLLMLLVLVISSSMAPAPGPPGGGLLKLFFSFFSYDQNINSININSTNVPPNSECSLDHSSNTHLKFSLLELNMQAGPVPKKITVGPIMRRVKPKISVSRNGQVHTYTSSEAATLAWLREQGLEISLNTLRSALNPHIPQPARVKRISDIEATIDFGRGINYTIKRLAGTHRDRHPHRRQR